MHHRHHHTPVVFTLEHEHRLMVACNNSALSILGLFLNQDLIMVIDILAIGAVVMVVPHLSRAVRMKMCVALVWVALHEVSRSVAVSC